MKHKIVIEVECENAEAVAHMLYHVHQWVYQHPNNRDLVSYRHTRKGKLVKEKKEWEEKGGD